MADSFLSIEHLFPIFFNGLQQWLASSVLIVDLNWIKTL